LPGTNALAYLSPASVAKNKRFIKLTPVVAHLLVAAGGGGGKEGGRGLLGAGTSRCLSPPEGHTHANEERERERDWKMVSYDLFMLPNIEMR
jgi:hypothetical protein